MLKRINPSLPGLVAGIIGYGFIVQLAGVWFVEEKTGYSIGLWYGIAIAVGMAIHIATTIYDAVTIYGEANANKQATAKYLLRYMVVAVLFFILGYFKFGNLFAAFLGVLGLKFSAYAQPLLNKHVNKLEGRDDAASEEENSEKENE